MTNPRLTVDQLTSDALDHLYDRLEHAEQQLAAAGLTPVDTDRGESPFGWSESVTP